MNILTALCEFHQSIHLSLTAFERTLALGESQDLAKDKIILAENYLLMQEINSHRHGIESMKKWINSYLQGQYELDHIEEYGSGEDIQDIHEFLLYEFSGEFGFYPLGKLSDLLKNYLSIFIELQKKRSELFNPIFKQMQAYKLAPDGSLIPMTAEEVRVSEIRNEQRSIDVYYKLLDYENLMGQVKQIIENRGDLAEVLKLLS